MAIYYIWGTKVSIAPDRVGNAQRIPDPEYDDLALDVALDHGDIDVASRLRDGEHAWAGAYETPGDEPFDAGGDADQVAGSISGEEE